MLKIQGLVTFEIRSANIIDLAVLVFFIRSSRAMIALVLFYPEYSLCCHSPVWVRIIACKLKLSRQYLPDFPIT